MTDPRPEDDHQGTSRRGLLGAAALVLALLFGLAGLQSWRDLSVARSRSQELQGRVEATETRIEALKERIHRLESDPRVLEHLAREQLGLVRPGDLVIVLPEEPAGEATRTRTTAAEDPSALRPPEARTGPAPPSGDLPGPG